VLALLAITALWGWTFIVVQDALIAYAVLPFLALRFGLGTACLLPAVLRPGSGLRAGLLPGIPLAGGYLAQTIGLQYTTASKAGLLTGLFVVITPLLAFTLARARPHPATMLAAAGALGGTILLVGPISSGNASHELLGDILEVVTAVCFSLHILLLARLAPGKDASRMALSQMAIAALLFTVGSFMHGGLPLPTPSIVLAVVITGVLASALAFWVQTFAQQRISPSRTAIILASEPAFATFFGLVLAGNRFSLLQGSGAALILAAIAWHELGPGVAAKRRSAAIEPDRSGADSRPASA
jgi:drug/metabolite transporter (DMT)-like permease